MDINKIELTHVDKDGKWVGLDSLLVVSGSKGSVQNSLKKVLEEYHLNGKFTEGNEAEQCYEIFRKIHKIDNDQQVTNEKFIEEFLQQFALYGISSAFKKFQRTEDLLPHEELAIINFADKFTTCTLNESVIASKTEGEVLKERSAEVVDIV